MPTFHPFPRLPYELRAMIWEASVEPRIVQLRLDEKYKCDDGGWKGTASSLKTPYRLCSPTPVPATIQACREARKLGLYKRVFTEFYAWKYYSVKPYVWLNLEIDMIDIGTMELRWVEPLKPVLTRLRLEREWYEEEWRLFEKEKTERFVHLREVHVVSPDWYQPFANGGLGDMRDIAQWPCGPGNVFFIDKKTGEMKDALEMEMIYKAYFG